MPSHLFRPPQLGPTELPNRMIVSPMCRYSAEDGSATDWHIQYLSSLGFSGAGLAMVEATGGVEPRDRVSHGCLGLYSDGNETVKREADERVLGEFRDLGEHPLRGREGTIRLWGCQAEV